MSRIDDFHKFLSNVYGSEIVNNLIEKDSEKNTISFKHDEVGLTKFIYKYYLSLAKRNLNQIEGCKDCKDIFGKFFLTRPFEFSNWRGELDFKEEHVKDIMIVGEAAGPTIKTHLNFSYGLCYLPVEPNGEMDWNKINDRLNEVEMDILKEKIYKDEDVHDIFLRVRKRRRNLKHYLWKYFFEIFIGPDNDLNKMFDSLYITDMTRCNLGKNDKWSSNKIWKNCKDNCKSLFLEEISIINPKLVLLMGNSAYEAFNSLLKTAKLTLETDNEINFPRSLQEDYKRYFGYVILGGKKIYIYNIYHVNGYYYGIGKKRRIPYREKNRFFYTNELKTKVLNWS